MKSRFSLLFSLLIVLTLALGACAPAVTEAPAEPDAPAVTEAPAEEPAVPAAEIALKVTGAVANEQAWTENEVKGMNAIEVESTNSQGEASKYNGVLFSELIAAAEPNADASMVVFVGDDGSTAEISLDDLMACTDCVASFRNKGGFSAVLPGYPGKMQVKGVIEIQVK